MEKRIAEYLLRLYAFSFLLPRFAWILKRGRPRWKSLPRPSPL